MVSLFTMLTLFHILINYKTKQNKTLDIEIHDLLEVSIENNGEPQDFPGFTRGMWVKRKPYNWIKDTY